MMGSSYGPFGRVVRAAATTSPRPTTSVFDENLALWLSFSVPLAISEMQSRSEAAIEHARDSAVELISSHGDDLQYGGKHQGAALAALAKAFAICASAPGGITALGIHACLAPHDQCPP
ncbi:hypothetical protein [Nocardia brasiliensis]|uniref:hypothetical protein n=1 Tax=Nocardia brasiliensis TaxID=37326 RepID=UPI002458802F|nr:hypothetical protein [Nocardia brasiliensis]